MRETRVIMGMPISMAVLDEGACQQDLDAVFAEFAAADRQFSPFKDDSEISRLNRGEIAEQDLTPRACGRFSLCAKKPRLKRRGLFQHSSAPMGRSIPAAWSRVGRSGTPRCNSRQWALRITASRPAATSNVMASMTRARDWTVGIRNPFQPDEIVKVLVPKGCGVATSGNYLRGDHIYDPHTGRYGSDDIVSLTIIGADVMEADRYATASFAMGRGGIQFIEKRAGPGRVWRSTETAWRA